jgi:hypothetical protein
MQRDYLTTSLSPPAPPRPPPRTATLPLPPDDGDREIFVGWLRPPGVASWVRTCAGATETQTWERLRARAAALKLHSSDMTVLRLGTSPNTTQRRPRR